MQESRVSMLATIKSLPANIVRYVSDYEQSNLRAKSKAILDSCFDSFACESPDSPYTQRIQKLTCHCPQVCDNKVRLHVFNADGEAFALGTGDICIFTALMDKLDDDELMFVIGHEIAHFVNEDALWGVRAALATEMAAYLATFALSRIPVGKAASAAVKTSLLRKLVCFTGRRIIDQLTVNLAKGITSICYSRAQEYRADQYGIRFLHTHGHRVEAAASALEKLRGGTPESRLEKLTSDHPEIDDRIAELNKLMKVLVA